MYTDVIFSAGTSDRFKASLMAVAPSSGADTDEKEPLKRAVGVRTAARMYASWISLGFLVEALKCRWTDWRRCCGEDEDIVDDLVESVWMERRRRGEDIIVKRRCLALNCLGNS